MRRESSTKLLDLPMRVLAVIVQKDGTRESPVKHSARDAQLVSIMMNLERQLAKIAHLAGQTVNENGQYCAQNV